MKWKVESLTRKIIDLRSFSTFQLPLFVFQNKMKRVNSNFWVHWIFFVLLSIFIWAFRKKLNCELKKKIVCHFNFGLNIKKYIPIVKNIIKFWNTIIGTFEILFHLECLVKGKRVECPFMWTQGLFTVTSLHSTYPWPSVALPFYWSLYDLTRMPRPPSSFCFLFFFYIKFKFDFIYLNWGYAIVLSSSRLSEIFILQRKLVLVTMGFSSLEQDFLFIPCNFSWPNGFIMQY